jgi:hypothetical protein
LDQSVKANFAGRLRTSRTSISYKEEEKALRVIMLSKIGVSEKTNRCDDGTANCGANTVCVPVDEDNYEVIIISNGRILNLTCVSCAF